MPQFRDKIKNKKFEYKKSKQEQALFSALSYNKEEYKKFIIQSNKFHDKYIHISHDISGFTDAISNLAESDGSGLDEILHRDYYIPQKANMKEFNEKTEPSLFLLLSPGVYLGKKLVSDSIKFERLKNVKFEDY